MPEAERIMKCGRCPVGRGRPQVKRINGRAYTSGLQTCRSVWACVTCSYKIRVKRAIDISLGVTTHIDAGGGVLHVVLTAPHRADEKLKDTWAMLSDCWSHVTSGGGWQAFKKRHGLVGFVRSAEVTHGGNGWHPHLHVLLFVDKPMSPVANEDAYYALRTAIRERWCDRMADKHRRTMSTEHGIRVDPVKLDEAAGSGQYVTKVGYELAMTNNKLGRQEGHRTPFAIARDAATTGDTADIQLFREWIRASHRKHSISWSEGLREHLGLGRDKTDEELADEDPGGETIAEIDPDLWRTITARRDGARARLLAAFETYDNPALATAAAVTFLRSIGYPAASFADPRSGQLVLGLEPNQPTTIGDRQQC